MMIALEVFTIIVLIVSTVIIYPQTLTQLFQIILRFVLYARALPSEWERIYREEQQQFQSISLQSSTTLSSSTSSSLSSLSSSSSTSVNKLLVNDDGDDDEHNENGENIVDDEDENEIMAQLSEIDDNDDQSYYSMSDTETQSLQQQQQPSSYKTRQQRSHSIAEFKHRVHSRILQNSLNKTRGTTNYNNASDSDNEDEDNGHKGDNGDDDDDENGKMNDENQNTATSTTTTTTTTVEFKPRKRKIMVDQEIQCDPLDFETLEMRSVLPFRHLTSAAAQASPSFSLSGKGLPHTHYRTIRTDLDTSDLLNYQGARYRIPAPFELFEMREKERLNSGQVSKMTKVGKYVRHVHVGSGGAVSTVNTPTMTPSDEQGGTVDNDENRAAMTMNEEEDDIREQRDEKQRQSTTKENTTTMATSTATLSAKTDVQTEPQQASKVGGRNRSLSCVTLPKRSSSEPSSMNSGSSGMNHDSANKLSRHSTTPHLTIETFKSNRIHRNAAPSRPQSIEHEEVGTESLSESDDLFSTATDTDDLVSSAPTPKPEENQSTQSTTHDFDSDDEGDMTHFPASPPSASHFDSVPVMNQELTLLYKTDMDTILQQTESVSTSVSNQVLRILEHVKMISEDCHSTANSSHFSNMKDKTSLTLCNANLLTCPYALMDAEQLATLDLSHNYLSSIPNWLCDSLKNSLTALSLCHNLLTDLPEKFSELKKLRELDLSYNKFEYIPVSVQQLPSLTSLDVSHNSIFIVAPGVCRLKHTLTELNLSFNNIMDVPEDFKHCRKLRYLKYSDNDILYSSMSSVLNKLSLEEFVRKKPLRQRSQSNLLGTLLGTGQSSQNFINSGQSTLNNQLPSRVLLLLDLLDSERRYVRYMNIFHDVYYIPLTTQLEELKKEFEFSISYQHLSVIIPSELYSIMIFARVFLSALMIKSKGMAYYESNPFALSNALVGHIFLQNVEAMKSLYVSYSILYDKAVDFLREIQRVNPEFDRFLKSRTKLPLCDGMTLESFLLLPIRRLSKYVDILQNLTRVTPESHPDYDSTRKALKKMHKLLTIHQKNIFIINNKHKIVELQKKLKVNDLLIPHRFLLKEGKLVLAQSRGLNNFKKEIMKQFATNTSIIDSVKELNPFFESFKAKLTGTTVDELREVRLTELTVYVYLFSDVILIKETNLLQKLVGRFYLYSLKGAMISEHEQSGESKEFSLIVRVQNPSTKLTSTKLLTFICEDRRDYVAWYTAIQKTVSILNPSIRLDSVSSVEEEDNEEEEEEEEEEVDHALDHAYENCDRESVLKYNDEFLNTSIEYPSPRQSPRDSAAHESSSIGDLISGADDNSTPDVSTSTKTTTTTATNEPPPQESPTHSSSSSSRRKSLSFRRRASRSGNSFDGAVPSDLLSSSPNKNSK